MGMVFEPIWSGKGFSLLQTVCTVNVFRNLCRGTSLAYFRKTSHFISHPISSGRKDGIENRFFGSDIASGFEGLGGTPPPKL